MKYSLKTCRGLTLAGLTEEGKKISWKHLCWDKFSLIRKAKAIHRHKVKRFLYLLHSASRQISSYPEEQDLSRHCVHVLRKPQWQQTVALLSLPFPHLSLLITRSWEHRKCSFGHCLPDVLAVYPHSLLPTPRGWKKILDRIQSLLSSSQNTVCYQQHPSHKSKAQNYVCCCDKKKLHWSQADNANPSSTHVDSGTAWSKCLEEIDAIVVEEHCADRHVHICILCSDAYKKLIT